MIAWVSMEAEAWLMEQPRPRKRTAAIWPPWMATSSFTSSPQSGVAPSPLRLGPPPPRHAEAVHQRLGAVMTGPDSHPFPVKDRPHVVGVDIRVVKGYHTAAAGGIQRAVDNELFSLAKAAQSVPGELFLVG